MKLLKYISIIGILILNSCSNSGEYKIEKKFKSVVNNENCKIEYFYPEFITKYSIDEVSELNNFLERHVDYESYAYKCDEKKNEKRIIKGDYKITLKTENNLSVEFVTNIINFGGNRMDTIYHSIVLKPKKIGEKMESIIQLDPKSIIPNFDKEDLYEYVKEYNSKSQNKINLRAYEPKNNYAITWGINEDEFLLYVGGEGEWFGNDVIRIPMNELKKENNR